MLHNYIGIDEYTVVKGAIALSKIKLSIFFVFFSKIKGEDKFFI